MIRSRLNQYLLITLLFLSGVSASLFFFTRESKPDIDKDLFRIPELEKIDAVILTSPQSKVTLKFDNNRWRVNDTWEADAQMIKVLFATLRQVEPRRPVSASLQDSVRQLLERRGIRVSLSEQGVERASFIVGGNDLKTEAWFLRSGENQPYVMNIPGYRVYVAGVFELTQSDWRNKRIFDFNWRNFKSLVAAYPKEPKQGFEIIMQQGSFGIRDLEATDTARLNTYLDHVSLLFASHFIERGNSRIDSLVSTPPAAHIEINDIANRSFSLDLFAPGKTDREVYGRLGDGQIVSLEKNQIAEIVRKKDYFRPNPAR